MKRPRLFGKVRCTKARLFQAELGSVKNRLAIIRDEAGETNEGLAASLGVNPESVRQWMKGETLPSAESLIVLAHDYQRSVDWILGLADDAKHPSARTPAEERAITRRLLHTFSARRKREDALSGPTEDEMRRSFENPPTLAPSLESKARRRSQ